MNGKSRAVLILQLVALAGCLALVGGCDGCGGGGNDDVEICDNFFDDDGNGLTDCDDPACDDHVTCSGEDCTTPEDDDGDGLVNCDDPDCRGHESCGGDGDADGDADGDGDSDPVECERSDCEGLYSRCEVGDCTASGEDYECCVSADTTCDTIITLGEMYEDLEIDYRGFYSNEHSCRVERTELEGYENMVFRAETRGLACVHGYINIRVRVRVEDVTMETPYSLCDDGSPSSLNVTVTIGEGGTDQHTYINYDCGTPGEFVVEELGEETGEPYAFIARGRLSELSDDGRTVIGSIEIDIDSEGIVELNVDTP